MDKYIILGHENPDVDSIVSGILLEKYIKQVYKVECEFIIPDKELDEDTIDICNKFNINFQKYRRNVKDSDKKIILVDHSNRSFVDKEIVGIIDHHPKMINFNVLNNKNIPSSSTSCLIVKDNEEYFNKEDIKLAILAAYVDTASFHSTKGLESDKEWCLKMCHKYNFDEALFNEAGLVLTDISSLDKAMFNGLKKYEKDGKIIESSYIQIKDFYKNEKKIMSILSKIIDYFYESDLDGYCFVVLDMDSFKSIAYNIIGDSFYTVKYDKYTSRGTVIIPEMFDKIKNENIKRKQL